MVSNSLGPKCGTVHELVNTILRNVQKLVKMCIYSLKNYYFSDDKYAMAIGLIWRS